MSSRSNVLVLGHSFVRRLFQMVRGHDNPVFSRDLGMSDRARVRYLGIGGGTIDTLLTDDRVHTELTSFPPNIVVLQIGGNDVDTKGFVPDRYLEKLKTFFTKLREEYGVNVIVICDIFGRPSVRLRTGLELYHEVKNKINLQLYLEYFSLKDNVLYWQHSGGILYDEKYYLDDGVHLNTEGNVKFFKSLRGAVRKALANI